MHLCIQHSPTTYLSTEKSRRWGRTVVHTDGSGKHLRQRPWTTGLPPLRNLKDPIHDSAMSVNATTSIGSPCRRLVGSSTRRSRFRTQAHHLRQALARYPFIHSEIFDLRLSPTESMTRLPPRGPDAECGTTWVHTAVGVYAPVRLHSLRKRVFRLM